MPRNIHLMTASLAVALCCVGVQRSQAGKKVYVGTQSPGKQVAYHQADHSSWDGLLKKYVDKDGFVDYRSWNASTQDKAALNAYMAGLSKVSPKLKSTSEAKLAFWINAYNAVTLHGMLREYPTSSIRNHTARLYGYNIWKDLQLYVGGKPYALDDMEHEVLREMNEPRIHFAVVCASTGCPRLLNEAYVPDRIGQQLDVNAKDFFSRPANFQHNGNRMGLSAILKWYGGDFGANQAAQLKAYSAWLPTKAAQQAAKANAVSVSFLDYDWSINEQKSKSGK